MCVILENCLVGKQKNKKRERLENEQETTIIVKSYGQSKGEEKPSA